MTNLSWDLLRVMKPECLLVVLLLVVFVARKTKAAEHKLFVPVFNVLLGVNFILGFFFLQDGVLFHHMYYTNEQVVLEKNILNLGLLLISLVSHDWIAQRKNAGVFYLLLISSMLGMFLLISSGNFLLFFIALELAVLPIVALSALDKERLQSTEGAFRNSMASLFGTGIMLFAVSLLYGTTGTLDFAKMFSAMTATYLQMAAFILFLVGCATKLLVIAVPFRPVDVVADAPVPVAAITSTLLKGALIFVFTMILSTVFVSFYPVWEKIIFCSAIVLLLTGTVMAIREKNVMRLLAFVSLTQMGYLMLGLIVGPGTGIGIASIIFFVLTNIFSSLAVYGVVTIVQYRTGKSMLSDYRGMYQHNKFLSIILGIGLLSLAGVPPTAGFFGMYALVKSALVYDNYILLSVTAISLLASVFYLGRFMKMIFVDKAEIPLERITASRITLLGLIICVTGIALIGIAGVAYDYIAGFFGIHS